MKHLRLTGLAVAAALLVAASGSAWSLELKAASGSPPTHPSYDPMYTRFMEKLAEFTGGELTAKHIGLEVVNLRQIPTAISTGLVDVGNILPSYFPADFPNMLLLGELGPLGSNGYVQMAAVIDYMVTCADCQKEFADKGLVYVNNASTWPSQVHTTKKAVRTLADLKGLRLRSAGGYTTTWLEFMGAVPVEVTFNEEYEALQTGLVEGSAVPRDNVFGNRLYEMVRFSTPVNIGTFHALANFTTRQQTWAGFSPKLREAYIKAALLGALGYTTASKGVGEKAMDEMKARGGVIVEPSQELLDENEKFRAKVLETAIELGTSRYKLNDPDGKAKRFAALVKHWTPIIEPIQGDVDAVAKAIWDGVWAKVDLATYGG